MSVNTTSIILFDGEDNDIDIHRLNQLIDTIVISLYEIQYRQAIKLKKELELQDCIYINNLHKIEFLSFLDDTEKANLIEDEEIELISIMQKKIEFSFQSDYEKESLTEKILKGKPFLILDSKIRIKNLFLIEAKSID